MKITGAGWGGTGTTSVAAARVARRGPVRPDARDVGTPRAGGSLEQLLPGRCRGLACDARRLGIDRRLAGLLAVAGVRQAVAGCARSTHGPGLGELVRQRSRIHARTAPGMDVGPPEVATLLDRVWDMHFGGWDGVLDRDRTRCGIRGTQRIGASCVSAGPPCRVGARRWMGTVASCARG